MATLIEAEKLDEPEFAWGKKRCVGKNKEVKFYETFAYDGEDYALYDDVFVRKSDEPEPYIGKLVNIWKESDGSKMVKLQWFFRPREISYYLGDAEVMGNELFFASGDGIGLSNINPLEAIVGKCNIVCISKDGRNPQPSAEEIQGSHYVFYRIFDVKSCTISDHMDDKVGRIEVKYVFNRTKILKPYDALKLNLIGKAEEKKLIGENSLQLLNNVIQEENNDMSGKEVTNVKEMAMKLGRLHGSSSGVCVESSKVQAKMEGATRDAINFGDLDGTILSSEVQSHGEDAKVHTTTNAHSSRSKPKFNKNLDEPREVVNLAEKSSFLDKKLPKTPRFKHGYLVGLEKNAKGNGSTYREKDYVGRENDNKLGENLRANVERPPKVNGLDKEMLKSGSIEDIQVDWRAAKLVKNSDDSRKRTLKRSVHLSKEELHTKNDLGHGNYDSKLTKGSRSLGGPPTKKGKFGDAIKLFEDLKNNVEKMNLEMHREEIKKSTSLVTHDTSTKLRHGNGAMMERLDGNIAKKKDDSVKMLKRSKDNTIEEDCSDGINNFGNIAKKKDDSFKMLKRSEDNTIEEDCSDGINNFPRLAANEEMKILKHPKSAINEHRSDKLGKPSKSDLQVSAIKSCDDWKVEYLKSLEDQLIKKSNWLKLSWESKMNAAHEKGTLVLLQNLDPEYTSEEVEDIVFHAFKEDSTSKTVQHTATSNPCSGQAFVILKSRETVDRILKILDDRCLMLPNQRPLVACTVDFPKFLGKQTFAGHLTADKFRRRSKRDNTNQEVVATSHYSQGNTAEYWMAIDWCHLQLRSDRWWNMLYEQQGEEMQKLANKLEPKTKSLK